MGYTKEDVAMTKDRMKRFVRFKEGAEMYGLGISKFQQVAKEAKAVYKVGRASLVNTERLEKYLESFRQS